MTDTATRAPLKPGAQAPKGKTPPMIAVDHEAMLLSEDPNMNRLDV
ncbi:hypothetical protein [Novosphingobium sp. PY1]|nr:hypothetical protein [Novosphingobium sp. PY1]